MRGALCALLAVGIAGCTKDGPPADADGASGDTAADSGSSDAGTDVAGDSAEDIGGSDAEPDSRSDADADGVVPPVDAAACGSSTDCDDGDVCTDDICLEGACRHYPSSAACDDGDACTTGDRCVAGACRGVPDTCDDGDPCTVDTCADGSCAHANVLLACDDGDPCTVGDSCGPSGCAGEALACDDGDPCTVDTCEEGACVATPSPGADCDDGDACTVGDACGDDLSCAGTTKPCDDGDPCTNDACTPGTGACVATPFEGPCDDGDPCTTGESCDAAGTCGGGTETTCDDGDPCTEDICDASKGGCGHVAIVPCCGDGSCDPGETCGSCVDDCGCPAAPHACATIECVNGTACMPQPVGCDDGDPCTLDGCDLQTGCTHEPTACCGDGTCDPGEFQAGCQQDCASNCPDGACTGLENNSNCSQDCPVSCGNGSCDPNENCTTCPKDCGCPIGDACTAHACVNGACVSKPKLKCNDGVACTTDSCDPVEGCVNTLVGTCCGDGVCDPDSGESGASCPKDCSAGSCCSLHPGDPAPGCGDNGCLACVCALQPSCCQQWSKGCAALAKVDCVSQCPACDTCGNGTCGPSEDCSACAEDCGCDDGDACTQDACVGTPQGPKCAHQPIAACCGNGACEAGETCATCAADCGCDDGDACTVDACSPAGQCVNKAVKCGDGNPCTADSCDSATGCVFSPVADGSPCGCGGTCQAGSCAGAVDCDDGNDCTLDACVSGSCQNTPDTGRVCDDGDACTAGDACNAAGVCKGGCEVCDAAGNHWDPTCAVEGARCAGGMMCHLGRCGDAWCDHATEDHASCPADCFAECYGHQALCARKLPEVTVLSAHNADVSTAYPFPGLINYNQSFSLSTQLDHGVRRLLLDTAYCVPEELGGGAGTDLDWMCLCHGDHCYGGLLPLEWGLEEIATWMADNPSEVVQIQLENYVDEDQLYGAFEDAGLTEYMVDAPHLVGLDSDCDLTTLEEVWPWSLNNMARRNKRLLVFGGGNLNGGCLLGKSEGAAPPGSDVGCFKGELAPGQLYSLSQMHGLLCDSSGCWGDMLLSYCANTVEAVTARLDDCQAELAALDTTGWVSASGVPLTPRVNAINVDFYHVGAGPVAVVEQLNGVDHIDQEWFDVCGETPILLPCFSNLDCASDVCINGFCAECAKNADCGEQEFCDPVIKLCWAQLDDGAPCIQDDNCKSGSCNLFCGGCTSNADCGAGEFCNLLASCEPLLGAGGVCLSGSWCQSGSCPLGACAECDANSDCAVDEYCNVFGVCAPDIANGLPCAGNASCQSGHCFGGLCVQCSADGHCSGSEFCLAGWCVDKAPDGTPCTSDGQCQGDCNVGLCMECDKDADCQTGQYCSWADLGCEAKLGDNALCFSDSECASGACAGVCVECKGDGDCGSGEFCDLLGNCVSLLSDGAVCVGDADCQSGHCAYFLACVECESNSHCGSDEFCDTVTGNCKNKKNNGDLCTGDAQCKNGSCCVTCSSWCSFSL